jgi:hypothetical protein
MYRDIILIYLVLFYFLLYCTLHNVLIKKPRQIFLAGRKISR